MTEEGIKLQDLYEALGGEVPPGLRRKIDPKFCVYRFALEASSKAAWEEANRTCQYISCWRMSDPPTRASRSYYVIAMGEDPKRVTEAAEIFVRWGAVSDKLPEGIARALAIRRYGTALEESRKPVAQRTLRHEHRDMHARLTPDGRMKPYDDDEESTT